MATLDEVLRRDGETNTTKLADAANALTSAGSNVSRSANVNLNNMTIPQIESAMKIVKDKEASVESPAIKEKLKMLSAQYALARRKIQGIYRQAYENGNEGVKGVLEGKANYLTLCQISSTTISTNRVDRADHLDYGAAARLRDFFAASGIPLDKIAIGLGISVAGLGTIGALTGGGGFAAMGALFSNPMFLGVLASAAAGGLIIAAPALIKAWRKVRENRAELEALKSDMENEAFKTEEQQRQENIKARIQNGDFTPAQITVENKETIKQGMINAGWTAEKLNDYLVMHKSDLNNIKENLLIQIYTEAEPEIKKLKETKDKTLGEEKYKKKTTLEPEDFSNENYTSHKDAIVNRMSELWESNFKTLYAGTDYTHIPPMGGEPAKPLTPDQQVNFKDAVYAAYKKYIEKQDELDQKDVERESFDNYVAFKEEMKKPTTDLDKAMALPGITEEMVDKYLKDTSVKDSEKNVAKQAKEVLSVQNKIKSLAEKDYEEIYDTVEAVSDAAAKTYLTTTAPSPKYTQAKKDLDGIAVIVSKNVEVDYKDIMDAYNDLSTAAKADSKIKDKIEEIQKINDAVEAIENLDSDKDYAKIVSETKTTYADYAKYIQKDARTKDKYDNAKHDVDLLDKIEEIELKDYGDILNEHTKLKSPTAKKDLEATEKYKNAKNIDKEVTEIIALGSTPADIKDNYIQIIAKYENSSYKNILEQLDPIKAIYDKAKGKTNLHSNKAYNKAVELMQKFNELLEKGGTHKHLYDELDNLIKTINSESSLKDDEIKILVQRVEYERDRHINKDSSKKMSGSATSKYANDYENADEVTKLKMDFDNLIKDKTPEELTELKQRIADEPNLSNEEKRKLFMNIDLQLAAQKGDE